MILRSFSSLPNEGMAMTNDPFSHKINSSPGLIVALQAAISRLKFPNLNLGQGIGSEQSKINHI